MHLLCHLDDNSKISRVRHNAMTCALDRLTSLSHYRPLDALKEAGCEKWFVDKMTGSKAEKKGLDEALAYVRAGDTFVVWKRDRAGRSLTHLIELLKGLIDE